MVFMQLVKKQKPVRHLTYQIGRYFYNFIEV